METGGKMPYTVIYTTAPRCAYCHREMDSWIMFAEVHYHDECWAKKCSEEMKEAMRRALEHTTPNAQINGGTPSAESNCPAKIGDT